MCNARWPISGDGISTNITYLVKRIMKANITWPPRQCHQCLTRLWEMSPLQARFKSGLHLVADSRPYHFAAFGDYEHNRASQSTIRAWC